MVRWGPFVELAWNDPNVYCTDDNLPYFG